MERPLNATCLKPIKINAELYYAIASEGVQQDKPKVYISQAIAKGCQPLVTMWNELVEIDLKVKDSKGKECAEDTIAEITLELKINISRLHDQLPLALMILGNANVQVAQLRHDHFKPFVHHDYHELLCHTNPLEEQIFRDNLKQKIGDLLKIKQVTCQFRGKKHRHTGGSSCQGSGQSRDFLGRNSGSRGQNSHHKSSHQGQGKGHSSGHRSQNQSGQNKNQQRSSHNNSK